MRILLCECVRTPDKSLASRLVSAGLDPVTLEDSSLLLDRDVLASNGAEAIPVILYDTAPLRLISLVSGIREAGVEIPVLILSPGFESHMRALLMDAGADDVIEMDVCDGELRARVNAIMRRINNKRATSVAVGDLLISLLGEQPIWKGAPLNLTAREIAVLRIIASGDGRPVSREDIYNALYGLAADPPFKRVIDVFICNMRKKLSSVTGRRFLVTIPGGYYKLSDAT